MTITLEVCVESIAGCRTAAAGGADRIELCANLAQGGTTPSHGTMVRARAATQLPIVALIRPRAGDFVYDDDELAAMVSDVELARTVGLDGVAIGVLTGDRRIDADRTAALMRAARPLAVTFHRAFDQLDDRAAGLDALADLDVDRLLTSGGAPNAPAGATALRELVERSNGRIEIVAGGGIGAANATALIAATGVPAVHASCSRPRPSGGGVDLGSGAQAEPGARDTDLDLVRALAAVTSRA